MSVRFQATYSRQELMVVTAARALGDRQVVFVGVGLPNLACNLARQTHAPCLSLVYESGIFGSLPVQAPQSIGDPSLVAGAASVCSLPEMFLFYLQGGLIDVGFLGAAQIDRFGNINTTVIGPYEQPTVRLPGSGGACEIALLARSVFIVMRQTPKTFVERVDFVTSPGHQRGATGRRGQGGGPKLVMTDLATFAFREDGEMTLRSIHPGVEYDDVQAATGWRLRRPEELVITPAPTADELHILRTEVDGDGHYLAAKAG